MVQNPDRLLTKDELMRNIWHNDYSGTEESLVKHINAIRKALYDEERKKIVETVPTLGYRFNPKEATAISEGLGMEKPSEEEVRATEQEVLSIGAENGQSTSQVVSDQTLIIPRSPTVETGKRIAEDEEIRNVESNEARTSSTVLSPKGEESGEVDEAHRTDSRSGKD